MNTLIYFVAANMRRIMKRGLLLLGFVFSTAVYAGNAVTSVDATILPSGKISVRVGLQSMLADSPAGFSIANPARIALDLQNTGNALGKNVIQTNVGALSSVNVVQAGNRTRLVFNLSKPVEYETRLDGKFLYVTLGDEVSKGASPTNVTASFAQASPVRGTHHSIKDVDFRRGPNGEARFMVMLSDAQTGINIRQQDASVVIDFLDTEIPKALQRRLDVSDYATPVKSINSYPLSNNSRISLENTGVWEYSAYQMDNQFIVEVKPTEQENKKAADGTPIYTGEKLSLNFQNVDLRAVLQVIADFTGLNIIASDTVSGKLTLRLKDVPWDQALDLILTTKGLDKRLNGNVMLVAPRDQLVNMEKSKLENKATVQELEPLVTEYLQLNYIRADEAQTILNGGSLAASSSSNKASCSIGSEGVSSSASASAAAAKGDEGQKILSKRGRTSYDLKTNTLIVNDTAAKIQEIRELLTKIDVPARQVMIEARVVIADETFSRQLGARLGTGLGGSLANGSQQIGFSGNSTSAGAIALAGSPTSTTPGAIFDTSGPVSTAVSNISLPAASTATPGSFGLALLNVATGNLVTLELQAMEADNRGKTISNPRIVTTNQVPAVILQGDEVPYATTSSTGTQTSFKTVALCLLVDPQILNNDTVILNVEVQKDAIGGNTSAGPALNRKRVKTQVRVANGETAVLGGIFEQINRNDVNKVPLLGDLPFVGNLFKNTNKSEAKVELMIFLTPKILDDRLTLQ